MRFFGLSLRCFGQYNAKTPLSCATVGFYLAYLPSRHMKPRLHLGGGSAQEHGVGGFAGDKDSGTLSFWHRVSMPILRSAGRSRAVNADETAAVHINQTFFSRRTE